MSNLINFENHFNVADGEVDQLGPNLVGRECHELCVSGPAHAVSDT